MRKLQMTRTPQKEIVDPPSWLAEKSRDETRTRGLATSTEVTGNAFVGHRLSFARAQKLDEPLIETFKMPIENNYRLTESVGDEAFAAKLAYKKYMQRKEQLGVLASKAKTIISEKREKDFSEELKQVSNSCELSSLSIGLCVLFAVVTSQYLLIFRLNDPFVQLQEELKRFQALRKKKEVLNWSRALFPVDF